jgi:hypothetical protein
MFEMWNIKLFFISESYLNDFKSDAINANEVASFYQREGRNQ